MQGMFTATIYKKHIQAALKCAVKWKLRCVWTQVLCDFVGSVL